MANGAGIGPAFAASFMAVATTSTDFESRCELKGEVVCPNMNRKENQGFTLIELLVVIATFQQ